MTANEDAAVAAGSDAADKLASSDAQAATTTKKLNITVDFG